MPRKKQDLFFETDDVKLPKDKIVKKILNDFKTSENARGKWEDRKRKNWESYEGILPEKNFPWEGCSNVDVPLDRIVVDTYWASLSSSFNATDNLISARPISADDVQTAEKRTQFLNVELFNTMNIDAVKDKIFEISLKYGDCITKQRYIHVEKAKTESELESELTAQLANQEELAVDESKVVLDGGKIDIPNLEDIYKPADSIGLQSDTCEFIIHRIRLSRTEYQNRVDTMGYKKIDFKSVSTGGDEKLTYANNDERKKNDLGLSPTLDDSDYYINILEWYGAYLNEKTDRIEELIIVVHPKSKTLLKAFRNDLGFRPFVQFTPFPSANQPYGKGFPEILKYLKAELNTIHNQRRDSEAKRIAQPGFYDKGTSFNPKKFTMEPNGMYPTDGPPTNAVHFPNYQGAGADSYREEDMIFRLVEQLTAIGKPIQGVTSPGDTTATEISNVVQRANVRFNLVFKRYERSFLEMVKQIAALYKMHMPEEKEFRILGSDGRFKYTTIAKSELGDKLDLIFEGSSVADENIEIQKAMQRYQLGIQNPLIAGDPAALYNLTKETFEKLGAKNIDKVLPMPPQAAVRTPQEENELMYKGNLIPVDLRENPELHLVMHDAEVNQPGFREQVPPEIQQIFDEHIRQTKSLAAAQRVMQQGGTMQGVGPSGINPNTSQAAPQVGGGGIQQAPQPSAPPKPRPKT